MFTENWIEFAVHKVSSKSLQKNVAADGPKVIMEVIIPHGIIIIIFLSIKVHGDVTSYFGSTSGNFLVIESHRALTP